MAHEIGHHLGARHPNLGAEGCNAQDVRTDWPYATAAIQQPALDFLNNKLVPRSTKDVMSYCNPTFFSPHTYTKLYLNMPSTQSVSLEVPQAPVSQEYLRISALVYKNGNVEFDPIFHFTSSSTPQNPPPGTAYCLELRDSSEALLDQVCFDLPFIDEEDGAPVDVDSFMIHLPLASGTAKGPLEFYRALRALLDSVSWQRVLFGSDYPFLKLLINQERWVKAFTEIPDSVKERGIVFTDEEIKGIMGGNAARLLGLTG